MRDAVVRRQGRAILTVEDFTLEHGQNIVLLGPNGAGKSTFVQLITREVHPLHRDEPPVTVCGQERMLLSDLQVLMGVVTNTMQDTINVHLPAIELVYGSLFGTLGVPRNAIVTEESHAAAMHALELLGIAHLADRDVKTLSSGEARRVLIARALITDPEVLVLDEPCTALDPEGMYYVRHAMRNLVAAGKSLILVTHYPEDIIPEIDRVLMIKDAHIFADGSKADLLTNETMTALFEIPMEVHNRNGYYSLVSEY